MKRRSPDTLLAIGILLSLFLVIAIGVLVAPSKEPLPPLSSRSSDPAGAKALFEWLSAIGYTVENAPVATFAVPKGTQIVFLLDPDRFPAISSGEWEALDKFVEGGGVLVAAGDGAGSMLAAGHFGFSVEQRGYEYYLKAFVPLPYSRLVPEQHEVVTDTYLTSEKSNYLPLLAAEGRPYAVSIAKGKGQVILAADGKLFSNQGLKKKGAPELLGSLLANMRLGGKIWFDEWHHGERGIVIERAGPGDWLLYTPAGQGVLLAALAVLLWIVLGGKRFGRPAPVERETTRRAPLEYVKALAGLNQRAGHRAEILREYYRQLKRSLGQRYRLDPGLDDIEYVRRLAEIRPEIDSAGLLRLLGRLKQGKASEQEMVDLANQAAGWMRQNED